MASNNYETVAGVLVGEDEHTVVVRNTFTDEIKKIRIEGRQVYVKKCKRPEQVSGIIMTERRMKDHPFSTILAVGTGCGKPDANWPRKTKREKGVWEHVRHLENPVKPLDQILTPDDHEHGIWRSPYHAEDFFIKETLIKAIFSRDGDEAATLGD